MITLLVGEQKVPFHVHMDILCRRSSFFESAFMGSGHFKETSEKSMTLPEDDAQVFDNLIQWLYSGKLLNIAQSAVKESREQADKLYLQLALLYVTADKYIIHELQNHVMSYICKLKQVHRPVPPGPNVINYIYNNSAQNSPFRRLLVQWYVWTVPLSIYSQPSMLEWLRAKSDFAADLVVELSLRASGEKNPWETGFERFHLSTGNRGDKIASNDSPIN